MLLVIIQFILSGKCQAAAFPTAQSDQATTGRDRVRESTSAKPQNAETANLCLRGEDAALAVKAEEIEAPVEEATVGIGVLKTDLRQGDTAEKGRSLAEPPETPSSSSPILMAPFPKTRSKIFSKVNSLCLEKFERLWSRLRHQVPTLMPSSSTNFWKMQPELRKSNLYIYSE